ncbi:MAG TPA: vWA domain-containing protein [Candidatus Kapabacteria bacterium]|nr:vWA domain-containing protein [Candidatus Kapabacteria bacterium]
MSSERAFFPVMEEFGFFSHIYEKLPEDFTSIFEIARMLDDEANLLTQKLVPVLNLAVRTANEPDEAPEDPHRYTPSGGRYAADLIKNYHDVSRIYPSQFLLPDEIFLQRLALRELWMPVSRSGTILPIDDTGPGFTFDSRKQKVYVLFDTSRSMMLHHRIHLAKAILYVFLNRNKLELGHISLRTFDERVGDLHTAVDKQSYDALMRYVLRITHLGEGTVLQKAILQALDDVHEMEHLAGAEILIITDGAVQLDVELIRSKMDEHVLIHAVKIGHVEVYASDAQIADMVARGQIKDRTLLDLQSQKADIEHQLRVTEGAARRGALEHMLESVRAQMAQRKVPFGHELEQLSSAYINVDDLSEADRFRADHAAIEDLESIARAIEEEAAEFLTPELTRKLAVLHDHVKFLDRYETDAALRARLKGIDDQLRRLLGEFLGAPEETSGGVTAEGAILGGTAQPARLPMTDEDIRDLHFLLESDMSLSRGWSLLIRWLWQRSKEMGRKIRRR